MADSKITLEILIKESGGKKTKEQVKAVQKALKGLGAETTVVTDKTKKASKAANEYKRNLEGTAQRSGRAGKDFARMAQGMGGLVQAYATVAANVFALSSAFLVLRRAADLSSMIKSAEDFSNRYGRSVTSITKRVQEATGGALDFAEALPSINKAISANISSDKIVELAKAATLASQTFGGTANEALNRFISAAQRGRVEIIQTLGIVIQTEKAYEDYAASIGRAKNDLTSFDKQQAIVNATIEESRNVFDKVTIDPNPFQQFLTTIVDLKNELSTFITDNLTPLINAFNKSKAAAALLIALIVKSVAGKIFPALGEQLDISRKRSIEATTQAVVELRKANRLKERAVLESRQAVEGIELKSLRKQLLQQKAGLEAQVKQEGVFGQEVINKRLEVNRQILGSQRALIAKEIRLREAELRSRTPMKGHQKALAGQSLAQLKVYETQLAQTAASIEKGNIALEKRDKALAKVTTRTKKFAATSSAAFASVTAQIKRLGSAYRTGIDKTFSDPSIINALGRTRAAWGKFAIDVVTFKGSNIMYSFQRAVGRTSGIVSRAFSSMLSIFTTLSIAISIGAILWEKYGDKIRGITPEMRKIKDASEQFKKDLTEISDRTLKVNAKFNEEINTLKKLSDVLKFTAGSYGEVSEAIIRYRQEVIKARGKDFSEIAEERKKLEAERKRLQEVVSEELKKRPPFASDYNLLLPGTVELELSKAQLKLMEVDEELKRLDKSATDFVSGAGPKLAQAFILLNQNLELSGFNLKQFLAADAFENFAKQQGLSISFAEKWAIYFALITDNGKNLVSIIEAITKGTGRDSSVLVDKILIFVQSLASSIASATGEVDSFINTMKRLDRDTSNFFSNISRNFLTTGPLKDYTNNLLNITTELERITDPKQPKNTRLDELFANKEELAAIKAFLGLAEEATYGQAKEAAVTKEKEIIELKRKTLELLNQEKRLQAEINIYKNKIIESNRDEYSNLINTVKTEEQLRLNKIRQLKLKKQEEEILKNNLINSGKTGEQHELELALARARVEETGLLITNEEKLKEIAKERAKIAALELLLTQQKKQLTVDNAILAAQKNLLDTFAQQTNYAQEDAEILTARVQLKEKEYVLALRNLGIDRARNLAVTTNKNEREAILQQSYAEEKSLRARYNLELELLKLQERAKVAETSGVSIFDKEGLKLSAEFFIDEVKKQANNLKTTFEILGRGFVKIINDQFDKAVDTLLEGGKDFGRVMLETFKAGLREVLGEALKTRIKEAFAGIFKRKEEEEVETELSKNTAALDALTAAINKRCEEEKATGTLPSVPGLRVNPSAGATPSIFSSISTAMEAGYNTSNSLLDNVVESIKEGNATSNEIKEVNEGGFGGLVGQFQNVFNSIGGLFSGEGGFGDVGSSLLGLAGTLFSFQNGGIARGGFSGIPQLATGAIATGPSLAMIGEGSRNEAVVPLPNNREIPVDLKGSAQTIKIEQNFDFRNSDANTVASLRSEARLIEERTFNRVFSEINKGGKYAKISGRRY